MRHLQPGITAGIDPLKRFQVHIDIERQAMKSASTSYPSTQRSHFISINVYSRRPGHALSRHVILRQHADYGFLDTAYKLTDTQTFSPDIHQGVSHDLAGPVVGDLPSPVHLDDRDIARRQYMFSLARLSLREDRGMLNQPKLIWVSLSRISVNACISRQTGS